MRKSIHPQIFDVSTIHTNGASTYSLKKAPLEKKAELPEYDEVSDIDAFRAKAGVRVHAEAETAASRFRKRWKKHST